MEGWGNGSRGRRRPRPRGESSMGADLDEFGEDGLALGRLMGSRDPWAETRPSEAELRRQERLARLSESAVAVVPDCLVLGGHGLAPKVGERWALIFAEDELRLEPQ